MKQALRDRFRALTAFIVIPGVPKMWAPYYAEHLPDVTNNLWAATHAYVMTGDHDVACHALRDRTEWLVHLFEPPVAPPQHVTSYARRLADAMRDTPAAPGADSILAAAFAHSGDHLAAWVTGQHTNEYGQTVANLASQHLAGN